MKKAILLISSYTVIFILTLLFLAGMIPLLKKVFINSRLDEDLINQQCRQSVYQNSETRLPVVETENIPIKCPTKYITFHKDYAEQEYESNPFDKTRGGESIKLSNIKYKKCDADDKEACMFRAINKIFADEISRCWNNFFRGQKRVFSLYEEGRQCVVCSVLMFDSEIKKEQSGKGLVGMSHPEDENYNLDLYMRQNNNLRYTGNKNYYEYTLDIIDQTFGLPYYDYDPSYDYAVVFIALNKQNIDLLGEEVWKKIKEKLAGYEEGEEDNGNYVNRIELIRNDAITSWCDTWG